MNIHSEKILILDFGSQTTQLIARRIREQKVYCEMHPYTLALEKIKEMQPKGIVLSGGPASVYDEDAPLSDPGLFDLGVPVLGICYGAQLMTHQLGGRVERAVKREFGDSLIAVTPGIRPAWSLVEGDDQKRIVTPAAAVTRGADYIVVGRPIRDATDPLAAAQNVCDEIASAL